MTTTKKKIKLPIYLNNQELFLNRDEFYKIPLLSFLQALGIQTPHFCFNPNLSIAGNCRMCLIELGKGGKPLPSCAINLTPQMEIYTDTPAIKKLRESVLEFLLLNHPLDCPICDQGGNCDLQDYAEKHGSPSSRGYEMAKRTKVKKAYTAMIKIILTRCIHCTRCIRFSEELANSPNLGMGYRGRKSEIVIFNEKLHKRYNSKVLAHLIDLCPVGAITNKKDSYKFRTWEFLYYPGIDPTNSLGDEMVYTTDLNNLFGATPHYAKNDFIGDRGRFHFFIDDAKGGLRHIKPTHNIISQEKIKLNLIYYKYKDIMFGQPQFDKRAQKDIENFTFSPLHHSYVQKHCEEIINTTLFAETLYNKWLNNLKISINPIQTNSNFSTTNLKTFKKARTLLDKALNKFFVGFRFIHEIPTLEIYLRKLKNFKGIDSNFILKTSLSFFFRNKNKNNKILFSNNLFLKSAFSAQKMNYNTNAFFNNFGIQKIHATNINLLKIHRFMNDVLFNTLLEIKNRTQKKLNKFQKDHQFFTSPVSLTIKTQNATYLPQYLHTENSKFNLMVNTTPYDNSPYPWELTLPQQKLTEHSGYLFNSFGHSKKNAGILNQRFLIKYFHVSKLLPNLNILNTINTQYTEIYMFI